jgi:hypothetical protein
MKEILAAAVDSRQVVAGSQMAEAVVDTEPWLDLHHHVLNWKDFIYIYSDSLAT